MRRTELASGSRRRSATSGTAASIKPNRYLEFDFPVAVVTKGERFQPMPRSQRGAVYRRRSHGPG